MASQNVIEFKENRSGSTSAAGPLQKLPPASPDAPKWRPRCTRRLPNVFKDNRKMVSQMLFWRGKEQKSARVEQFSSICVDLREPLIESSTHRVLERSAAEAVACESAALCFSIVSTACRARGRFTILLNYIVNVQ